MTNTEARRKLIQKAVEFNGDYSSLNIEKSRLENSPSSIQEPFILHSSTLVEKDEEYPEYFYNLTENPLVLFCYGNKHLLEIDNRLGVVGTRKPTKIGLQAIKGILDYTINHYSLLNERFAIVNGMARGIDALAARVAMKYKIPIIMYLGSGIDFVYPSEAQDIYDYCLRGNGLVLSEYPNLVPPRKEHFPFRNRLIAATSSLLFVPEASLPSGTFSTVNYALNLGIPIATCPFPFTAVNNLNNILIKEGAESILSGKDLVEFIEYNKVAYKL